MRVCVRECARAWGPFIVYASVIAYASGNEPVFRGGRGGGLLFDKADRIILLLVCEFFGLRGAVWALCRLNL